MSSPWDVYQARIDARGGDRRGTVLRREQQYLERKLPSSLSYHPLTIDGEERVLAVINTDNLDTKILCSMPGDDIPHGGIVEWMENHWLITEKDANNEVYTKAKMRQCNYFLQWVDAENNIVQRWCIVEDGTKYLTGEYGDRNYVVNRGDSRVYLYLPRDDDTIKLNRTNRFLIDDYDSPNVLAYRLTKPFKLGGSYNGNGVLAFVLTECNTEDTDNLELHIPNYYDHFPRDEVHPDPADAPAIVPDEEDHGGWL